MSIYIALVGENDDTVLLVRCTDEDQAEEVAREAVWSSGGVSAYRVPSDAIDASADMIQALTNGDDLDNAVADSKPFPIRVAD